MLSCDMNTKCGSSATHIDHKGYIYCDRHGQQRAMGGIPVRKMSDDSWGQDPSVCKNVEVQESDFSIIDVYS